MGPAYATAAKEMQKYCEFVAAVHTDSTKMPPGAFYCFNVLGDNPVLY